MTLPWLEDALYQNSFYLLFVEQVSGIYNLEGFLRVSRKEAKTISSTLIPRVKDDRPTANIFDEEERSLNESKWS
jgi:hypothetical protein